MSNVIGGISGGGFSCCVSGTLLWINNIDLYWWIDGVVMSIDVCWPPDLVSLWGLVGTRWMSFFFSFFLVGAPPIHPRILLSQLGSGWGGSRACWVMGTARRRHSPTPRSGYGPTLMSLAGAASGSRGARTNSGKGHGKRRDGSAELCYHWHSDWRVCVRACKCVCLSSKRTDWLTVNPPAVCMICPILHPATLCKQQPSGPEESHWQEVPTSLCEQDGGRGLEKKKKWRVGVIPTTKLCNLSEFKGVTAVPPNHSLQGSFTKSFISVTSVSEVVHKWLSDINSLGCQVGTHSSGVSWIDWLPD